MAEYVGRARELAARLQALPGIIVQPPVPHTNGFQLWLRGEPAALLERHRAFAHDQKTWLFGGFQATALADHSMVEIVIEDASDHYSLDEATGWIGAFVV